MSTTRLNGSLYVRQDGHIATIEFGHPASNSFPSELLSRLSQTFIELSENQSVRVVCLKSEGDRAFCAGASLTDLIKVTNPEEGKAFFMGFARVINSMRECKKIIVCRVQGKAVGGGVGLIAACDYALAANGAAIKLSELTIGIGPFVISPALINKIGNAAFSQLTLGAHRWQNAYWVKEKGLYAGVYDTVKELNKETWNLCQKLEAYNPNALFEMKKLFWKNTENWPQEMENLAATSGRLLCDAHTQEALNKFRK